MTGGRVLYGPIFILPILIPGIVIGAMWGCCCCDFGLANPTSALPVSVVWLGQGRRWRPSSW
jgi:multiple sugar transport system permease protein